MTVPDYTKDSSNTYMYKCVASNSIRGNFYTVEKVQQFDALRMCKLLLRPACWHILLIV